MQSAAGGGPLAEIKITALQGGFGRTQRRDAWWVESLPVWILLGGFGIYATFRAFMGDFFQSAPYLSPFYSPLIDADHHIWKWSPALLILAFTLGFRMTWFSYRKGYHRAFLSVPPGCAACVPAWPYTC